MLELLMTVLTGLLTGTVIIRYMDRVKGGPGHQSQVRAVRFDNVRHQIILTAQPGDNKTHWRLSLTLARTTDLSKVYAALVARLGVTPAEVVGNNGSPGDQAALRVELARLEQLHGEQKAEHDRHQAAEAERAVQREGLVNDRRALEELIVEVDEESRRATAARAAAEEALEQTELELDEVRDKLEAIRKKADALAAARQLLAEANLDLADPGVLAALRGEPAK
ncbi:MAG: hypothetical protein Q7K39_01790 [Candidatus Magasanikbacteria bacterium]|nr:hypothetical protein [Candidatus Magasanikbacteria bacterium]